MIKLEYMVGQMSNNWEPADEQAQLNAAGNNGWELVSVLNRKMDGREITTYYFKRVFHSQKDARPGRFRQFLISALRKLYK